MTALSIRRKKKMIEVCIETGIQCEYDIEALLCTACTAALSDRQAVGDVTIAVVDDETIRCMNRGYRNVDRPTDVLSFPAKEGAQLIAPPDGFLGDIVISFPRSMAQAEEYGHSQERELSFLAVHGTLHLLGYDHQSEQEASEMFALQEKILNEMELFR